MGQLKYPYDITNEKMTQMRKWPKGL